MPPLPNGECAGQSDTLEAEQAIREHDMPRASEVFDVWSDETIKAMTVYDPTSKDGKLVKSKKRDAFHDASAHAKSSRSPRCEVAVRAVQSMGA